MKVVGQADDEHVQVAPYMVVDVTNVRSMTKKVDYVVYRFPGGGAGTWPGVPSSGRPAATAL